MFVDELQRKIPAVSVAGFFGIQRGPGLQVPEVHYFRPQDANVAQSIGDLISSFTKLTTKVAKLNDEGRRGGQIDVLFPDNQSVAKNKPEKTAAAAVNKEGYIFIGNLGFNNIIKSPTISSVGERLSSFEINFLEEGKELYVYTPLNLRERQPPNDSNYFNGVTALGVLLPGTKVTVISQPVVVERPSNSQIWAKVRVDSD